MNDATLHFLHHVELPPSLPQVIQADIDCYKRQAAHHCFDRAQCRGYQQSRVSKKGGNRWMLPLYLTTQITITQISSWFCCLPFSTLVQSHPIDIYGCTTLTKAWDFQNQDMHCEQQCHDCSLSCCHASISKKYHWKASFTLDMQTQQTMPK